MPQSIMPQNSQPEATATCTPLDWALARAPSPAVGLKEDSSAGPKRRVGPLAEDIFLNGATFSP
eukprot:1974153-Alexandrium_andersonii.AAC.1